VSVDKWVVVDPDKVEQTWERLRLVARAMELLAEITPTIPGASVTLTPAQQDELRQIILAMPLMVAV
jgi:hypothetical protein